MVYTQFPNGDVLSLMTQRIDAMFDAVRGLERGTVAPNITPTGLVWNRTDHPAIGEAWMRWNGSAFVLLLDPEAVQVNASGSIPYSANQPMGGFVLTGLGAGSANGHSVRYEQVILRSGANAMAANLAMGGFTITGIGADLALGGFKVTGLGVPSAPDDAARKADVAAAAPTSATFTTTTGATASATVTLGFQPSHLIIALDRASGGSNVIMVNAPGAASNETVGGISPAGYLAVTIARTGTGFTISFANPNSGSAWSGRVMAWG